MINISKIARFYKENLALHDFFFSILFGSK